MAATATEKKHTEDAIAATADPHGYVDPTTPPGKTPMTTDLHCWHDFENGHTCMLPDGHIGPHEPTPDRDILIQLVEDTDG